jgi:hypothetical protein
MLQAKLRLWTSLLVLGSASVGIASVTLGASTASATDGSFHVSHIFLGSSLHHSFTLAGSATVHTDALTNPDDISQWGDDLFVGFQNGVGPEGQASTDGNLDSTVVECTLRGHVLAQWDVIGKTDGVTVDPTLGVLATVNEDAHSALYLIRPSAPASDAVTRFAYSETLPHLGGTDAITIDDGQILISASAPGTNGASAPQSTYPAVYAVTLDEATKVASVSPLFFDESSATVANLGNSFGAATPLGLTDPDSSEMVPWSSSRFGGDFMLTSQGDLQQIYVRGVGTLHQQLRVLTLTQSVDDTAWTADSEGVLFATDSTNDAVDVMTGHFNRRQPTVVATPCGANSAPGTCPAPNFPANYLATLNLETGTVTPVAVSGSPFVPQGGLAFVSDHDGHGGHGNDGR